MSAFKGFANFGLGGVLVPPALAAAVVVNSGLAMPTPVNRGALSTATDGRKIALPPYGGEYLLLPNYMTINTAISTNADLHLLRYDSAGVLSWDWDKTDLTTEGVSTASGAGLMGIFLDTVDQAIFVFVADTPYSAVAGDLVLARITYDATGTISQTNAVQTATASSAANGFYQNTRTGNYMARNGLGTGAFTLRRQGYTYNNAINEGALSGGIISTTALTTAGGIANYQNEAGTIFLESWNNTHICLRKGGVSRSIATALLPNAVPTFGGGITPSSQFTASGAAYALPSNATLGPGIFVMPWGDNEVVLCALSTESIFGERYYKRNEFDTWLANLCTFIGI